MSHHPPRSGLVISKLGVQATTEGETVLGLLCLKVSLPRDAEGSHIARYPLFSASARPPKAVSRPEIHALPLHSSHLDHASTVTTASRLLSLGSSYPPTRPSSDVKPTVEVSHKTGQVSLVLDPRRGASPRNDPEGARKDWLVCLRFECPVTQYGSTSQVLLNLPRCLDNVIRFQIVLPEAGPSDASGEISMLTEPKVHALPPSAFRPPRPSRPARSPSHGMQKVGADEGWEDGEDVGSADPMSEDESTDESEDERGGCWLEGRFQCTESLRLEWSSGSPSRSGCGSLTISPKWDSRRPSIDVVFESAPIQHTEVLPIEVVIPDGWGWSQISFKGEGLQSWRSIDGDWWDLPPDEDDSTIDDASTMTELDDSFSTVIQRQRANTSPRTPVSGQPSRSGSVPRPTSAASLLRQKIPAHLGKMEDFSFEMGNASIDMRNPRTPLSKPSTPTPLSEVTAMGASLRDSSQSATEVTRVRKPIGRPAPARLFDLTLTASSTFAIQGVLVPMSRLTLVSPSLPLPIPFVRVHTVGSRMSTDTLCEITCPAANLTIPVETGRTVEIAPDTNTIGTFSWTDDHSQLLPERVGEINGNVNVLVERDVWGSLTMHIRLPWPTRTTEVGFTIPSSDVRLVRATSRGGAVPRALCVMDSETIIRLGEVDDVRRGVMGTVEVVLETRATNSVPLPVFCGQGQLSVRLKGEHWDLTTRRVDTNMSLETHGHWTEELDSSTPPRLTIVDSAQSSGTAGSMRRQARGLLSWNVLFNLFIAYVVISLATHVQNLRTEVAFVAEEARDLRLYGIATVTAPTLSTGYASTIADSHESSHTTLWTASSQSSILEEGPSSSGVSSRHEGNVVGTSVGRVVFGRSAWDTWAAHPTVQTLGKSLAWVWNAVVWLIVP